MAFSSSSAIVRGGAGPGAEHHVPALDVGPYVGVADTLHDRAQVGHRELPPTTHVDAPEQRHHDRHGPSLTRPRLPAAASATRAPRSGDPPTLSGPTPPSGERATVPTDRPSTVPIADVATVDLRDLVSGNPVARRRFTAESRRQPRRDRLREGGRSRRGPGTPRGRVPGGGGGLRPTRRGQDPLRAARAARRPGPGALRPGEGQGRRRRRPQGVLAHRAVRRARARPTSGPTEVPDFATEMTLLHAVDGTDGRAAPRGGGRAPRAPPPTAGRPRCRAPTRSCGSCTTRRSPDGAAPGAVRAAAHEDINFITLLPGGHRRRSAAARSAGQVVPGRRSGR